MEDMRIHSTGGNSPEIPGDLAPTPGLPESGGCQEAVILRLSSACGRKGADEPDEILVRAAIQPIVVRKTQRDAGAVHNGSLATADVFQE